MAVLKGTVDELASFILRDVEGLESGQRKGAGAYGAVFEVTVRGFPCIAKRLHDILVNHEVSRRERTALQEKFRQECVTLSKLKHPNIVHFVGVHYGRAPGDLSLIMEKLHIDLGKCLDTKPNIPLPLKLSILLDVSYGLLYLHTMTPPIIHRDLTASNILLTSDMRAKIADLGVSKILDLHAQVARAQTKAPGTQYYMPPDALSDHPQYGVELDVFSFGHLALYTITQAPPEPDDSKITPTAVERGEVQIAKRKASINIMGRDHCLCPLIMQCLQDKPERRPSTSDLNQAVKELSVDLTHEGDENRKLLDDLQEANKDRGYLREALAAAATNTEELVIRVQLLEAQNDGLDPKEEAAQQQLKSLSDSYRTMQEQCQEMKVENQKLLQQMEKLHTLSDSNAELQKTIDEQQYQISLMTQLKEDLEAAKAEALIYKEDFEKERQDRAKAFGKMDEQREQHTKEVVKFMAKVEHANKQLALHQQQLEQSHQYHLKQAEEVQQELVRAQEEVRAKTSQVKQYKKQVDQLKTQVTELEGQNVCLIEPIEGVCKEREKTKGSTKLAQKLALRKKKPDKSLASLEQLMSMPPLQTESTLAKAEIHYERERDKNDALRQELEKLQAQQNKLYQENARLRQMLESASAPPPPPRTASMDEDLDAEHQSLHSQEKSKQQLQQQHEGNPRLAKTEVLSVQSGGIGIATQHDQPVPGGGSGLGVSTHPDQPVVRAGGGVPTHPDQPVVRAGGGVPTHPDQPVVRAGGGVPTHPDQPVVRAGGGVPTHPGAGGVSTHPDQPQAAVDPRFQSNAGPQPPKSAPLHDHHQEAYRQCSHSDTEQRPHSGDTEPPHPAGLTHPPIPQEYKAQGQAYEMGELHHGVDKAIHHVAEDVISAVDDESGHCIVTQQHILYDPNLTCPYCD